MSLIILANVIFGDEDKEEFYMKYTVWFKVIMVVIGIFILLGCDNKEDERDKKDDFEFTGNETWVVAHPFGGRGFYYIEDGNNIGKGKIIFSSFINNDNLSCLEIYRVEDFLETDIGQILYISLRYVYVVEVYGNEFGRWCRFSPKWTYIDLAALDACEQKYNLVIDNVFKNIIGNVVVDKNNINSNVWSRYGWSLYFEEGESEISSVYEISSVVLSKEDLELLIGAYIPDLKEEEKESFLKEISEGFFEIGNSSINRSEVMFFDKIWKTNISGSKIEVDLSWRKDEIGPKYNLLSLDEYLGTLGDKALAGDTLRLSSSIKEYENLTDYIKHPRYMVILKDKTNFILEKTHYFGNIVIKR
jgi:hypothetical protein